MAASRTDREPNRRVHVVLVPGFAGFDALGQLEYYANLTPLFREWCLERGRRAALHYFDNFPTAAVATRAHRLERYLAKRIARAEFQEGDAIALVGHSTGGLDIRRLLVDLTEKTEREIAVDGGRRSACVVEAGEILQAIERVVFLSVPQWGTNIAGWVRDWALGRKLVVAELRAAVAASQVPLLDQVPRWIADQASALMDAQLFLAVKDALAEADTHAGEAEADTVEGRVLKAIRTAAAQEAEAELALWLRHIAVDFAVIDDLAVGARRPGRRTSGLSRVASPAHLSARQREEEVRRWRRHGIATRSYATVSPPSARKVPGARTRAGRVATDHVDAVYDACYRACARGPFEPPPSSRPVLSCLGIDQRTRLQAWLPDGSLPPSENDGIVNTASMLWPPAGTTILVPADHMDIVGHYDLVQARRNGARRYQAYDLLGSRSGFGPETFKAVWEDVFAFSCGVPSARLEAWTGAAGKP